MRVFVAISAHGFGHLMQIAPVIEELARRIPALHITIQSELDRQLIAGRITHTFDWISQPTDTGMIQHHALTIDARATREAHLAFHRQWHSLFARQTQLLAQINPDLVLADVPYLPLAAAQQLGLPNFALCSLNWVDILAAYLPTDDLSSEWFNTIKRSYAEATGFIIPAPGMSMNWLDNRRFVGPTLIPSASRREELDELLGMSPSDRLIMVNLGGITSDIPLHQWRLPPHLHLLATDFKHTESSNLHDFKKLPMSFSSLLA